MEIRAFQFYSTEYEQMVSLRITELLDPIGVPPSYIESEKEKHDLFIGAFENREMIGCCVLTPKTEDTLQLRQMAVRSDYRGKGVGTAIVEFAEEIARENNFSVLMMHARDAVINFYQKCGYAISGAQFFEVGIPHHKMQKQLSRPLV